MLAHHCSAKTDKVITPSCWEIDEIQARAGALVKKALANWPLEVQQNHWEDMKQTAVLTFLEHADQPQAYVYAIAHIALKNYTWVHIRRLNGGWKSLVARQYTVSNAPLEVEGDAFDQVRDNLHWRLPKTRPHELIPRPVEWEALRNLFPHGRPSTETLFRELLYILAGTAEDYWYPERIYRAALIMAMVLNDYFWEEIAERVEYPNPYQIYQQYLWKRIRPYSQLSPLYRVIIDQLGRSRLGYFEAINETWLNRPNRKMVVFDHAIYTLTYKQRYTREGDPFFEGTIQRGRRINGKTVVRGVNLGKAGDITKEKLWEASQRLEERLIELDAVPGSLGRISETRHALFAIA